MLEPLLKPFRYPKYSLDDGHEDHQSPARASTARRKVKNLGGTLLRIGSYVTRRPWQLTFVVVMILISSCMMLTGPVLVGTGIDKFLEEGGPGLVYLLIGLSLVYLLYPLSIWLQNVTMIGIAQSTVQSMREQLFRRLHKLPISYFDKRRHGDMMSRITNDIENVSSTLNTSFIQIVTSLISLTGILIVMIILSPLLTLLTFLVVPAMVVGMKWITRRTGKLFKDQQRNFGELNGYMEETLSGNKIVRVFSTEEQVKEAFREKNRQLRHSAFWAQTISGFIPKLMNGLNNFSFAVIAGIGGILAIREIVTVGTIVIFAEFSRQFTRPVNDLANQFNTVLSAVAGAERVFDVIDSDEEPERSEAGKLQTVKGAVRFHDVTFAYEDEGVIRNMSFDVKPGQTVALVGPTGAGKTTVINLLSRFYDADSGTISIDGRDITTIRRDSLRTHMAFVLQDPFLFRGTIRDNIRYGKLDATEDEIVEAAKAANAHGFIVRMPDGYDTMLEHEGAGISQGQKQLLSIARAMLARPTILILDEATSSIDTVTEIHIQEALRRLMHGRTSFVIAHRLNTIREADLILVIRDGAVVEQGSHEQLLEADGFYADLYRNQRRRSAMNDLV